MKMQPVRGTRDIIGAEAKLFREINQSFLDIAEIYDFQEIDTPIFEFTSVFKRTLGDASDIVNKEMYTFEDRSGDQLTLRPEGTASVVRAIISNSLLRDLPLKFFYTGPMFRHERPQKGRYRQFRQFGIELIGVDQALADVEVISCAWDFFKSCQLQDSVQLEINTIGDRESRDNYQKKLVDYFSQYKTQLSEDSQNRLVTNPLRILDSKDEVDKKLIDQAPRFTDCLNSESKDFFAQVTEGLNEVNIPFILNPLLVRGLDYYNHTVFEFTTEQLGSQNAVLSGGRYNNLVETMGGPSTPAVGWAAGMDRLALMLKVPKQQHQTVAVIAADEFSKKNLLQTLKLLRDNQIPAQAIYSGNISKQLKKANKRNCSHAVILGEKELQQNQVTIKDLSSGDQLQVDQQNIVNQLTRA